MFDVDIVWKQWLFFYMKNLWDDLNLFKLVCMDKSLYILSTMIGLFVWATWVCFKFYGKSWLKTQCCI